MIPEWVVDAFIAVRKALVVSGRWFGEVFRGPRFWKIASEFCSEAAVLIAVFPVLEKWISKGSIPTRWAVGSEAFALLLFGFAVILAWAEHAD